MLRSTSIYINNSSITCQIRISKDIFKWSNIGHKKLKLCKAFAFACCSLNDIFFRALLCDLGVLNVFNPSKYLSLRNLVRNWQMLSSALHYLVTSCLLPPTHPLSSSRKLWVMNPCVGVCRFGPYTRGGTLVSSTVTRNNTLGKDSISEIGHLVQWQLNSLCSFTKHKRILSAYINI